jgi:hypothetical protein
MEFFSVDFSAALIGGNFAATDNGGNNIFLLNND